MSKEMIETLEGADEGDSRAAKQHGDEAWTIEDPWGSLRFAGTRAEVRKAMQERIDLNGENRFFCRDCGSWLTEGGTVHDEGDHLA